MALGWHDMRWGFRGWSRWLSADRFLSDGSLLRLRVVWTGENYAGYAERWQTIGGKTHIETADYEPLYEVSLSTVKSWLEAFADKAGDAKQWPAAASNTPPVASKPPKPATPDPEAQGNLFGETVETDMEAKVV